MSEHSEISPTERIAAVSALLAFGHRLTTAQVSERFGITQNGALKLFYRISSVKELAVTYYDGEWYSLSAESRKRA